MDAIIKYQNLYQIKYIEDKMYFLILILKLLKINKNLIWVEVIRHSSLSKRMIVFYN
jgi:hypothetical protein